MPVVSGTNLRAYVGVTPFAFSTNCTISFEVEMIELAPTSISTAESRRIKPRRFNWSITVSALHSTGAAGISFSGIVSFATGFTPISIMVQDSENTYQGTGYVQSGQLVGPVAQNAAHNVTIVGTGDLQIVST